MMISYLFILLLPLLPGGLQEIEDLHDSCRLDAVARAFALVEAVALDHVRYEQSVADLLAVRQVLDRDIRAALGAVFERRILKALRILANHLIAPAVIDELDLIVKSLPQHGRQHAH